MGIYKPVNWLVSINAYQWNSAYCQWFQSSWKLFDGYNQDGSEQKIWF